MERAALRDRLATAAEVLIAILDVLDGDPDAEDGGNFEPSFGWTRTMACGATHDRECPDGEDGT